MTRTVEPPLVTVAPDSALSTQAQISGEIADRAAQFADQGDAFSAGIRPELDYAPYRSTVLRHPTNAGQPADPEEIELYSPVFGHQDVDPLDADLTIQHRGSPIGERIVVTGRILDGDGRPVAHQLVEIWQANSAGRYVHRRDQHPAPLDSNFTGMGRCLTAADGSYMFTTIKPGPYPWNNHYNAWRPAHIHFSVFGSEFTHRLVTQMYFPGDPLFALDPIYQSIYDPKARERLVASYDHEFTRHEWCTGYRWDVVLTGSNRTWTERST